jgi:hypothetical protein
MRDLKHHRSERLEAFAPEVQIMSKTSKTLAQRHSSLMLEEDEDDSSNSDDGCTVN